MARLARSTKSAVGSRLTKCSVCLLAALFPRPGQASQVIDEGTFAVTRGGDIIAREEFRITRTSAGFQLTSTVSYPPRRTRVVVTSTLTLGLDSLPTVFESQTEAGGYRVVAQFGPRRLVFRTESERGESAREYPAAPRSFVVSDSVFAFYAIPPRRVSGTVRLTWPREDRRTDFELTTRDGGTPVIDGRSTHVTVVVLSSGADRRECWFDDAGRLVKVEIPSTGIVAERIWDGAVR